VAVYPSAIVIGTPHKEAQYQVPVTFTFTFYPPVFGVGCREMTRGVVATAVADGESRRRAEQVGYGQTHESCPGCPFYATAHRSLHATA